MINHLIGYYSNNLLRRAIDYSSRNGKVLVFLDENGHLTFDLPSREKLTATDQESEKVRNGIEQKLKEYRDRHPDFQADLTSATMKIYRVSEEEVQDAIESLKQSPTLTEIEKKR